MAEGYSKEPGIEDYLGAFFKELCRTEKDEETDKRYGFNFHYLSNKL